MTDLLPRAIDESGVTGMKTKPQGLPLVEPLQSFGTIDCGLETMGEAWPAMVHSFSSGGVSSTSKLCLGGGRLPPTLLNDHPVDLLVVERGHFHRPSRGPANDMRSK